MSSDFEIAVLASGSKGNATVIRTGGKAYLIDAGISCLQITRRLAELDMSPADLECIFVTHEHIDHVKGLPVLSRKFNLPVFANEPTWARMPQRAEMERSICRLLPKTLSLGDITVTNFAVPHDAAATVGYVFTTAAERCVYLTDVGFVTEEIKQNVDAADVLVLEANHDIEMLKNGSYPQALKQRILGTHGHLSNAAAAWLLTQSAKLPQEVFLAHLSQENNLPSLARSTVEGILEEKNIGADMNLYVASQELVVKNF